MGVARLLPRPRVTILRRAIAGARRPLRLGAKRERAKARRARQVRKRFLAEAARFTPYVSVESHGLSFMVSTGDDRMGRFFRSQKRTELWVLEAVLAVLGERCGFDPGGTTFVDVGANIGTTSLAAYRAGFTNVLACEPEPSSARLLRANLALNGATDSVRALELALSNRTGTAALDLGSASRSEARVVAGPLGGGADETVDVRVTRLDDLAAEGVFDPRTVGLLWLDVEGHESHVLEGATLVLERSPPLVIELYPKLLRQAGKIDVLPEILARHYTHVFDLRRRESEPAPIAVVPRLIERYERSHTDLLVYRLPAATDEDDDEAEARRPI